MDSNPAPTAVPAQPLPAKPQVVPASPMNSMPPSEPAHKLSLPMLIVTVVVLVLAIGGVFAYRMYSQSKNNSSTDQTTQIPQPIVASPADNSSANVTPTPADDISGIDNNLKSIDGDLSTADAGLNDKPDDLTN